MKRLVLGFGLAFAGLFLTSASSPVLQPFNGKTLAEKPINLAPSRHEVVIIHFWASWCAPCRVEMPILESVWRKYGDAGLTVVGVSLDAGASRQKIAAAGSTVTFPLVRLGDSNVRPRDVPPALPETLIYGRDGRLRYRFGAGGTMLDAQTLDRIIPPLVAER